ncbi:MAG: YbaK/EbsC family protein [Parabacteroides sp.]|nr:YbaK/EbsC family protein [Parabacteroides sp.]
MSIEKVKAYLAGFGRDKDVMEFPVSSATVGLAAQALSVEPARIAKTLSFLGKDETRCILVVTAGDSKIDNTKFKRFFRMKARMLGPEKVSELTGHAVGGVCPFANPEGVETYLDVSLQRFTTVFPACGSGNSAIELNCEDLFRYARAAGWVDVTTGGAQVAL